MADLGSIEALKADIDAKVTTNGANENTGARVNTALNNMVDTLYTLSATPATLRTGSTIAFDVAAIYNSPTTPSSGTVTLDLSGAVAGTEAIACFNHAAEPTWPSGVSAVGSWNNSALNVVRFTYRDASNITATIISNAATTPSTNRWTRIDKTTTESRTTNTVLTADTDLAVPMAANKKYHIRGVLYGGQAGSGSGLKVGFTGPASPTLVRAMRIHTSTGTAPANTPATGYDTTGLNFTAGAGALHISLVDYYVENGANAGDFQITWAQVASSGTASNMGRGSYLEYIELP